MLFCLLVGLVYGGMVILVARANAVSQKAYIAGRRAGLKKACEIARTRSEIAFHTAPAGKMMVGALRAGMANQINEDILAELAETERRIKE